MRNFTAVIERDGDTGLYVGWVPGFSGAHSQAETLDELRANLQEVVEINSSTTETAYIEKNVKGYYPLEAVDLSDRDEKGFSLVVEEKDGMQYKRTYGFSGYHIRLISKTLYNSAPLPDVSPAREFDTAPGPETSTSRSIMSS